MRCLELKDLPPPPSGKSGWPWTEETSPAHEADWPLISVVTPSFNQAPFLEETIRSVLLQGYPSLEYVIIDGGSRDGSVEIIRKYERFLRYWCSERDRGQSDAINKGIAQCSGDVFNWINSDDLLVSGALQAIGTKWIEEPNRIISGGCELFDESGTFRMIVASGQTLRSFVRFWEAPDLAWTQQGSFMPLHLVKSTGGCREDLRYCMDRNLMVKLLVAGAEVSYVGRTIARFRMHSTSKTVSEAREFRLERINMLRKMALPVPVEDWEWDREQARRMVDLARRDLKVHRPLKAMAMFSRAVFCSPRGTLAEVSAIARRNIRKRLPW